MMVSFLTSSDNEPWPWPHPPPPPSLPASLVNTTPWVSHSSRHRRGESAVKSSPRQASAPKQTSARHARHQDGGSKDGSRPPLSGCSGTVELTQPSPTIGAWTSIPPILYCMLFSVAHATPLPLDGARGQEKNAAKALSLPFPFFLCCRPRRELVPHGPRGAGLRRCLGGQPRGRRHAVRSAGRLGLRLNPAHL